jgi:very-short-patch-repair endonuclease
MPNPLHEVLARQAGVISRKQALAAGLSKHAWDWRLSSGRWQRALPGVVVAHSGGISDEQRWWSALLYGGKGAALGGRTALELVGTRLSATGDGVAAIDVVIPHARRLTDAALPDGGAVAIRRLTHPAPWVWTWRGLEVVRAQAAVLHAVAWARSDAQAEFLLAATVQQRKTAVPLVRQALADMPELTRRGLVRELLDDLELGAHAMSELRFLRMCRSHGLPAPDELQRRVRVGGKTYYLDARYRLQRLSIEIDGAHHRDAGTWDADALRALRVAAALPGERIVRITTGMLRNHEHDVADLLRVLLSGRAAA